MKDINILSLVQAYDSLCSESYTCFNKHHDIEIRDDEVEDLITLTEILRELTNDNRIFDKFYVGYKIPQIGKEFDLLRFGRKCIINLEIKKKSTESKIKKQLARNKYYLEYLDRKVYNLTFISDDKKLYILKDNELLKCSTIYLKQLLEKQEVDSITNINDLFDPSNYLVSPFNSVQKFMTGSYFLTQQQEEIKEKITKSLVSSNTANFISIIGGAGTGKTLLVYDIAKELMSDGQKFLIIHCGNLNEGQLKLNQSGWDIIPIKTIESYDLSKFDLILVDEAQRIYPNQLNKLVHRIELNSGNCIFSYDKIQTLAAWEESRNIDGKINSINKITIYKLSEKIRTNKEISTFIKMLFDQKRKLDLSNQGNIELNYFNNIEDGKTYIDSLNHNEWKVLRFTPSQYNHEYHEQYSDISRETSHNVIGQEFDGVAVIIDEHFSYNRNGELYYQGKVYYHPTKMLFQNITRVRKRLNLIIINNEEILNRCLSILK